VSTKTELYIFTSDNAWFDFGGVRRSRVTFKRNYENITWALSKKVKRVEYGEERRSARLK
jgi:hypothetical protein